MRLSTSLRICRFHPYCIAFVGAGGKTTAMFQLAHELAPAIVTTSTHIGVWQASLADRHLIWVEPGEMPELEDNCAQGVTLLTRGRCEQQGRLEGLTPEQLDQLHGFAYRHNMPLLIEADGSRQLPVKAPALHEPDIPPFANLVVVVAGLSALGLPLTSEWVHREVLFSNLAGLTLGDSITPEALTRVLSHPEGGLKNIPTHARRVMALLQADTFHRQSQGQRIAMQLMAAYHSVVIASLWQITPTNSSESDVPLIVHAVHEPIAGIVLAAGGGSRMGRVKQILEWKGEVFVHRVARQALEADMSPVIVVTGAQADSVERAISDLPVRIAYNLDWQSGQSSSVHTGLRALDDNIGAAIFLLADQPQVSLQLLKALIAEHARNLAPIVAPMVDGQRGNPVLFDHRTFSDLMKLTGDTGGRALFSRYPISWVLWHDASVLADVDTEEDYRRLLSSL